MVGDILVNKRGNHCWKIIELDGELLDTIECLMTVGAYKKGDIFSYSDSDYGDYSRSWPRWKSKGWSIDKTQRFNILIDNYYEET